MKQIRTCIGCGEKGPRDRLLRLVPGAGRIVTLDPGKDSPGRGAWVHPRRSCLEEAGGPRALGRAFRGRARAPQPGALVEAARQEVESLKEE